MNSEVSSVIDLQLAQEETKELSDKYEILEQCGSGGCSKVFIGRRLSDDLQIAIKLLNIPDSLEDSEAKVTKRRFYAEARVLLKLTDDHSVQCYDYGLYEGTPCYVMEYIDGIQLNDYLRNSGALSFEVSVAIMKQVLSVLDQAHECGIYHRDIKPENILVLADTDPVTIRLIDFGIATISDRSISGAQQTLLGMIRGTPSYMAPEMFSGKVKASPESDIYACGLVLLECLTGNIAVPGTDIVQIATKHTKEELAIPPIIPPCLSKIIWKCCEKDPKNRYHCASDIIKDLDEALPKACEQRESLSRSYYNSSPSQKGFAPHSKSRLIIIAVIFLLVGAGISALIVTTQFGDKTSAQIEVPAAQTNAPAEAAIPNIAVQAPAPKEVPVPENDAASAQQLAADVQIADNQTDAIQEPANNSEVPSENPENAAADEIPPAPVVVAAPAPDPVKAAPAPAPVKAAPVKSKPSTTTKTTKSVNKNTAVADKPTEQSKSKSNSKKIDNSGIPLSIF